MHALIRRAELDQLGNLLDRHSAAAVISPPGLGGDEMLMALEAESTVPVIRVPNGRTEFVRTYAGLEILLASLRSLKLGDFESTELESRLRAENSDSPDSVREIADEVTRLISSMESEHGVLVIVPGADELDQPSQLVLGHMLRRMAGHRVKIAVSTGALSPTSLLAGVPSVELRHLSDSRMHELAEELTSGRVAAGVATVAVRTASGRPLALHQLLERLPSNQMEGSQALDLPLRLGPNADGMVSAAKNGLGDEAEVLLGLMSLAPLSPRPAVLGASREAQEWFSELESRGTVEKDGVYCRFSEELARVCKHRTLSVDERLAGHSLLAQRCEEGYPELHHWHRSFIDATEETPCQLLADSCALVSEGLDWAGIEFAERALALSMELGPVSTLLNDLAAALIDRGQIDFALRYLTYAARSTDVRVLVRARTLRVWAEFLVQQSVPLRLRNQWSRSEVTTAPAEVAHLQLVIALCHALRRETAEAHELLDNASNLSAHFDDRSLRLYRSLDVLLECGRGHDDRAMEDFWALDVAEDSDPVCLLLLSMGLMAAENYDSALATLDCLDTCGAREPIWDTQSKCVRAEIAIRRGDIGLAIALIDKCAASDASGGMIRRDRQLLLQCWSLLAQGRASDAETIEAALTVHAMASQNHSIVAELNAIQGNYLLRMGLPAEAVRHLHRCEELAMRELNPNVIRYEPDLIEALIATGRREHAGMLIRVFHGRVERVPSRWAELALERSRILLLPEAAGREAMGRLLGSWRPEDSQFDKGVTLLVMANRLAESGAHGGAAERARLAVGIFREVGSDHLADTALPDRTETRTEPAHNSLLDQLSTDERAVVDLVREGLKNREIAPRIFVSLRTVELRLTSVYRKLNVTSRTGLIARLANGAGLPVA
ncbi:MAG: helix-turn-helix transcriptional regulator [Brevibacterium aurantiacum]